VLAPVHSDPHILPAGSPSRAARLSALLFGMLDNETTQSSWRSSQPSSLAAERTAGFSAARCPPPEEFAAQGLDVPVADIVAAVEQVAGSAPPGCSSRARRSRDLPWLERAVRQYRAWAARA
jgi:hypothetical protein